MATIDYLCRIAPRLGGWRSPFVSLLTTQEIAHLTSEGATVENMGRVTRIQRVAATGRGLQHRAAYTVMALEDDPTFVFHYYTRDNLETPTHGMIYADWWAQAMQTHIAAIRERGYTNGD